MTKYLLTKPGGPWDFPALGFSAVDGAILDGDLPVAGTFTSAPGPEWSTTTGTESGINRYAPPSTTVTYSPIPVPQGLVDAVVTAYGTGALDGQVAGRINASGSATQQALSAAYVGTPGAGVADYAVPTRKSGAANGFQWTTKEEQVARALGWAIITDARHAGGADPSGVADVAPAIAAAEASGATRLFFPPGGTYRLATAITKSTPAAWHGGGTGFSNGSPASQVTRILVDGPTSGFAITVTGVSNVSFQGIEFTASASSASRDVVGGIYINGASVGYSSIEKCAFDNLSTGVKLGTSGNWVQGNAFNSCGLPIDVSGSENHILHNHGYGDGPVAAILLRSSANTVMGNKFFGDGASTPYGCVIWGYGNCVVGNIFDAFLEAGVLLEGHNTAPFNAGNPQCTDNLVTSNNLSGCGNLGNVAGRPSAGVYNAAVLVHAINGDVVDNIVSNNAVFNKRTDRATDVGVYLYADSGRQVTGTVISSNVLRNATVGVKRQGTTSGTKYRDNIGYLTENTGTASGYNGLSISHGLALTPSEVTITPDANNVYAGASWDATNITLKLRDSAGVLVPSGAPVSVRWAARA